MGGYDDHVAIMGDWMPPSPSPRSFFSSMINDERSIVDPTPENRSGPHFPAPEQYDQTQASTGGDSLNALAEPQMNSRGGLMERMAARAGFNAPRLNTESIRPADLSKNPEIRSPYLTIPPGLSPTTLLDSPVFLTNSLVLPSPTTGKFPFAPTNGNNWNSTLLRDDRDKGKENTFEDASAFAFKPVSESSSFPYFNAPNKGYPSGFAPQSFPSIGVSAHLDTSTLHQSVEPPKFNAQNNVAQFQQANFTNSHSEINTGTNFSPEQTYHSVVAENSPPLDEPQHEDDQKNGDSNVGGAPAEDGYNWRKYGQKQVKGSEFPRSYYKCTHTNCPVKKKVERSHEGHITEIIYKGAHTHPKPPPNRRSGLQVVDSEQNGDLVLNLDATSSAVPLGQEYNMQARYESGDGVDNKSTSNFSNDEDEDDRATHGSVSLGCDGEGDESESKRRRIETYASEMSGNTRAIREPRVVVQTTSEVDILDDGYRWRKYGQKVVKGNPNPRSYYKCTSPGCNVRKHVERASHDLKSVITTYEGKHNHDVPAARNSSHNHSNSGAHTHTQQAPPSNISSHMNRPDPSQMGPARFERAPMGPGPYSFPNRPQMGLGPGPGFGFGMSQQPGLAWPGRLPVNPYLGHHQTRPMMNNEMGFMMPKPEPKPEPVTESGLNVSDGGSSVYQQFMSRLPLGPHM